MTSKERNKSYYEKNKEAIKKRINQYTLDNKEKIKEYQASYREDNRETAVKYGRKYYKMNKTVVLQKRKLYSDNTKELRNKSNVARRKNDVLFRISSNLRSYIATVCNKKNYIKKSKMVDILGCSFEDFKNYIEGQFEPWMSWDNRGLYNGTPNYGWDIDHVTPISSANTEEELMVLFHYTNMRPLCSYQNRYIKRDKIS